jgi:endonuclease YncB( thermonuclease family)
MIYRNSTTVAPGIVRPCAAMIGSVAICAFGAAASAATGACDDGPWAAVETASVSDARTIVLGDSRPVRLAGLESLAALARDAKTADAMDARLAGRLAQLLAAKPLRIRILPGKPDRYGRHPALVMADDELLHEHLLSAGLAVFMPESFTGDAPASDDAGGTCARRLLAIEAAARLARRGGWSEPGIIVAAARPDALSTQFGHFVIFQGIVRSVGTRRDRTYIDFGSEWRSDVTVEIAANRRRHFGGEAALEALAGRLVRVRGFLQEKAGPMVPVRHPAQIEVLSGTESRQ